MARLGVSRVTCDSDDRVDGRSWEMAAVMSALGEDGCYTGTVEVAAAGGVEFGPVMGVHLKNKIAKTKIKTYNEIPYITYP